MSFRTVKAISGLTTLRKMKYGCNTVLLQVSRAFAVRSSPNMCWPIIGRCKFQGGLVEMWVTQMVIPSLLPGHSNLAPSHSDLQWLVMAFSRQIWRGKAWEIWYILFFHPHTHTQ